MKYRAIFDVKMPSNVKATQYTIDVDAQNPVEAMNNAIDEWKRVTEPRDVRIKELPKEGM